MANASKPNRVVIALGGNALGNTPEEQIARVREAAPTLLKVIEQVSVPMSELAAHVAARLA